eukprot:scaffold179822_cov31-Tisochrysis_lutea.AAC.8
MNGRGSAPCPYNRPRPNVKLSRDLPTTTNTEPLQVTTRHHPLDHHVGIGHQKRGAQMCQISRRQSSAFLQHALPTARSMRPNWTLYPTATSEPCALPRAPPNSPREDDIESRKLRSTTATSEAD